MYLSVEDIAELFGLSVSFAYRVVERMNADLASKNYYVILGRVPTRYVEDKIYGFSDFKSFATSSKTKLISLISDRIISIVFFFPTTHT